jgi:hypothetical protein
MRIPPHLKDQIGHFASQGGSVREMYEQQRQRDLEEQERQERASLPFHDNSPPRQLTAKDIADFEAASELYELREMAREVRKQDHLVEQIEGLMNRDIDAYHGSVWPEVYSRLTGADRDAAERV